MIVESYLEFVACGLEFTALFFQLQLLNDGRIASRMILPQIVQMSLPIGDHAEQAAAGMIVLAVFFQVAGQFIDPLRDKSDLDFRRAGIFRMRSAFLDNPGLLSCA